MTVRSSPAVRAPLNPIHSAGSHPARSTHATCARFATSPGSLRGLERFLMQSSSGGRVDEMRARGMERVDQLD
jgi:hypothetical protein